MGFIDIKNLVFEYFRRDEEGNVDEMVEALSDVSLDVEQGEFVAILGRNGSGKSTLAKQINALLTPSDGQVIVDGMNTEDEELRLNIRRTAGMVFQNPDNQIVGSIVEEDVAFGPENLGFSTEKIWNQVDGALTTTDMNEYRLNAPNKLSGGQKQRVAIAGVLAMEPKCIIFDESTSMLDPGSRLLMLDTAVKLNKNKKITVIWITHHMDEVYVADRVFVMREGRIEGRGTPKQIFANEQLLMECGLSMPQLLQYKRFLTGQGIISDTEAAIIDSNEQLIKLLCEKYGYGNKEQSPNLNNSKDGKLPYNEKSVLDSQDNIAKVVNSSYGENGNLAEGMSLTYIIRDMPMSVLRLII